MADSFDPYYTWLGIPPEESAAGGPDHYRLLGIRTFESNEEVITNASDQRMAYVRTFQTGKRAKESQQVLNEIAAAQVCLLSPEKKRAYDEALRQKLGAASKTPAATTPSPRTVAAVKPKLPVAQATGSAPAALGPRPHATPAQALDLAGQSFATINVVPAAPALKAISGPSRSNALAFSPPVLIGVGSLLGGATVLAAVVVWAATRSGPAPVTRTPAGQNATAANRGENAPRRPASKSPAPEATPSSVPSARASLSSEPAAPAAAPVVDSAPASSSPAVSANPVATTPAPPASVQAPRPAAPVINQSSPLTARPGLGELPSVTQFTTKERQPIPLLLEISTEVAPFHKVSMSPGGEFVAIVTAGWEDCKIVSLRSHKGAGFQQTDVQHVLFSDTGEIGLVGATEGIVYRWLANGELQEAASIVASSSTIRAAAISRDGRLLVAAMRQPPHLVGYDLKMRAPVDSIHTTLGEISWVGIHDDWIVCWSPEKNATEVISLRNPDERRTIEGMEYVPRALFQNGENPTVLAPSRATTNSTQISYWNLQTGQRYLEFQIDGTSTTSDLLAVSKDGRIMVLRHESAVSVANPMARKELSRIEFPEDYPARTKMVDAAITAEDGTLAFKGPGNAVWVIDLKQLMAKPSWRFVMRNGEHVLEAVELAASARSSNSANKNMSPAPKRVSDIDAAAAITTLRDLGVEIPDNPRAEMHLRLQGTRFAPEHAPLLGQLPKLQSLDLNNMPEAPAILENTPELPSLQGLTLTQTPVKDDDLKHIQKFPAIKQIGLFGTEIKGPGLASLRELKNLESLTLASFMPREIYPYLSELVQLKTFGEWPRGITDEDLALVCNMTRLYHVALDSDSLTPAGLVHLHRLKEVTYFMPPRNLNDEGLKVIAEMPGLKYLYMPNVEQITDAGYRSLAANRTITALELPTSATDADVEQVAAMRQLKHLTLWQQVTDACLPAVAKLPELESLRLVGSQLTGEGFASLRGAGALRRLHTDGVPIDDRTVGELSQMKQLESLRIERYRLSPEQIDALTRALPKCEVQNVNTGS